MNSVLIKNGTIIHADSQSIADILIQGETITSIGENLVLPSSTRIIDATGKLIFPGIIDPHTHMGIPIKSGFSADNFASGSRSALHGGVTTILDFTVLERDQTLMESLELRKNLARESVCDVGLHINITRFDPDILKEIPVLIKAGFSSFKVFTTYKESHMMLDYEQIEVIARIIAAHNGVLMVHAEDDGVISAAMSPYLEELETAPRFHPLGRPAEAEVVAVRRLGGISARSGCTMYIVHLNTAAGLKIATLYPNLKLETCPHYLLLNDGVYDQEDGHMYVASPPLRKKADQEALWQGLIDGHIDTIGSDHCPFCLEDKARNIPFQEIPNGMGGVETLFPVLLAKFLDQGLDLCLLTRLTSKQPAEIFGISSRKGSINPQMDADLLIVDPHNVKTDWEGTLHTHLDWNAYSGLPAIFPEMVFRRGEIVALQDKGLRPTSGVILGSRSRNQE
ncbi:MAG: amidohydrolase family protein [Candidatus Marinimicrobia bacterium]|nr:amidohydrolase family protein [Candidatus Neomarinimicrobiota bacterium]